MAAKLMIMPSGRSRYLKDNNMKIIFYSLIVVAVFMVISNYYMFSFMHAMKQVLMIVLALIATRETEILYYSMYFDTDRGQAKELITKSYPLMTALIYVLLIPIGTPLWLVVVGAVLATFLGKLMFGGFHHMVFHSSLVGVLFVTLGWTGLATSADLINSFDSFILELLFDNDFFNVTLGLGNVFDPGSSLSALKALTEGTPYNFIDVFLGLTPGIIGNGVVLVLVFAFLLFKKAINWILPSVLLVTFFITALVVGLINGDDFMFPLYQLFSGSLLFVVIFITTDPITTPIPTSAKIVYGVIAGALAVFIRIGGTYEEGIIFAVLFMSMLTPLLNVEMKPKVKDKIPKKAVNTEKAGA